MSAACAELWDVAENVTTTRLAHIEAAAALAMAERLERVSADTARVGREVLDQLWTVMDVIELDVALMASAAHLARTMGSAGTTPPTAPRPSR